MNYVKNGWEVSSAGREHLYIHDGSNTPDWLLGVCVDTWFYNDDHDIGAMPMGVSAPLSQAGFADFAIQALEHFTTAMQGFYQIDHIWIDYQIRQYPVTTYGTKIEGKTLSELQQRLYTELLNTPHVITGLHGYCDTFLTFRGFNQQTYARWCDVGGDFFLGPQIQGQQRSNNENSQLREWELMIGLRYLPLFYTTNETMLQRMRSTWDPAHLAFQDDELADQLGSIVTLLTPPAESPRDNRELAIINTQRLRERIAAWEQLAGQSFHWADHNIFSS